MLYLFPPNCDPALERFLFVQLDFQLPLFLLFGVDLFPHGLQPFLTLPYLKTEKKIVRLFHLACY